MKKNMKGLVTIICILLGNADGISVDKLKGEAYTDMGQIVAGHDPDGNRAADGSYLTRLGLSITATDVIESRLRLTVGVGGLFWQPFPTAPNEFWKNNLQFGPGITEASSEFYFRPQISLEGGYFPFKYDHASMNLGEYLLRSESYPTYLSTGGWSWVDSAVTKVLGLRLRADSWEGVFHHELGLFWEYQDPPLFDLTPAYVFAWKPVKGIEVGGGAALRRWFSNNLVFLGKDEKVSAAREYLEIANFPEVQNQGLVHYTYADGNGVRQEDSAFSAWRPGQVPDPNTFAATRGAVQILAIDDIQKGSPAGMRAGMRNFLMNTANCNSTGDECVHYLDAMSNVSVTGQDGNPLPGQSVPGIIMKHQILKRQAINLMGRVDIDLATLLGCGKVSGPFRLYLETAILGLENQPVYYEKLTNRIPILFGAHIPTVGILDLLALEAEFLRNPYQESEQSLGGGQYGPMAGQNLPIPDMAKDEYAKREFKPPSVHGDDWKWSAIAIKTIFPGVTLKLQAANDHMRLYSSEALPSPTPQTVALDHWYYLVHLQWGL
jgi:hypothetical protein